MTWLLTSLQPSAPHTATRLGPLAGAAGRRGGGRRGDASRMPPLHRHARIGSPWQACAMQIRPCRADETDAIAKIVNAAAEVYRGVDPADRWHEPYMPLEEVQGEIAAGVEFWGAERDGDLLRVMGIQDVRDVTLIRHAYVQPAAQGRGIGGALLAHLVARATQPLLVGTWAAAGWAIRFYERHGFTLLPPARAADLLLTYWTATDHQSRLGRRRGARRRLRLPAGPKAGRKPKRTSPWSGPSRRHRRWPAGWPPTGRPATSLPACWRCTNSVSSSTLPSSGPPSTAPPCRSCEVDPLGSAAQSFVVAKRCDRRPGGCVGALAALRRRGDPHVIPPCGVAGSSVIARLPSRSSATLSALRELGWLCCRRPPDVRVRERLGPVPQVDGHHALRVALGHRHVERLAGVVGVAAGALLGLDVLGPLVLGSRPWPRPPGRSRPGPPRGRDPPTRPRRSRAGRPA